MTLETMSVATCYPLLGLFCEYPSATCIQTVSVTVCKTMFRSALGRSRQPRAAEEAFSFVLTSLCPILGVCPWCGCQRRCSRTLAEPSEDTLWRFGVQRPRKVSGSAHRKKHRSISKSRGLFFLVPFGIIRRSFVPSPSFLLSVLSQKSRNYKKCLALNFK